MKEIGKLLKEKREAMNISLDDVHKSTKIQEKYISAIENDDISIFFAEVYYRSFVKTYARYLGFDSEELIENYNNTTKKHSLSTVSAKNEKSLNYVAKLINFFF
ncbi:MAG: helix-turn-helix domain-containing protein [Endomicrobium sp.]|jgi:cytoskeletal protein RodZ|nr:helix-turn-helix domain-containing protein [Endomicrobium sp.]